VKPSPEPGLSAGEAGRRLAAEGPNVLAGGRRRGALVIVLDLLREPMFALLLAGALIYLVLGDVHDALILGASLLLVVAITVVQERRSTPSRRDSSRRSSPPMSAMDLSASSAMVLTSCSS
jgi:Ca2+-transporting ATPase